MRRRSAATAGSPRERHERQVAGLLSERETMMNEIALRARLGALPPMLAKARKLLTNFWAKANWEGRAEILPVARMLLVLGAAQPALRPAPKPAPGTERRDAADRRRTRKAEASSRRKGAAAPRKAAETT